MAAGYTNENTIVMVKAKGFHVIYHGFTLNYT